MPLIEISGSDAVATRKTNPLATWGNRKQANRVEPVTKPGFAVPFQLEKGEKIFTVGSCFARHVEGALVKRGFKIPMRDLFETEEFRGVEMGVINNFATPSIYNEIAWAMGEVEFNPEDHIVEVQNNKFVDLHVIPSLRPAERDVVMRRRNAITRAYQSFKECRVVIITLGLVEIWYDSKTGFYLNSPPRPILLKNEPDRFKVHVLSFEDAYNYLDKAINLLKKHGRQDLRIVLTVSPVPLAVTHRDQDVIVANAYSKSVLRTVADSIIAKHEIITYYPSYESCTISDRKIAWRDDMTHVTDEIVALNINRMVDAFVQSEWSIDDHREAIEAGGELMAVERAAAMREGSADEAREFFQAFGEFSKTSNDFAMEHAQFLLSVEEFNGALAIIDQMPNSDQTAVQTLKAQVLLKNGDPKAAYNVVEAVAVPGAKLPPSVWQLFFNAAKATDESELVLKVLEKWSVALPRRAGRANGLVGRWFHLKGDYKTAVKYFEIGTAVDVGDALIRIYHVETLLAMMKFDDAKKVFAEIKPQMANEVILYDRLKPRVEG
jgi:tetratricopeptide (TPR) repeat protein